MRLENYGLSISDADAAIKADPSFVKGFYRKGAALLALNELEKALTNFKRVTLRDIKY